MNPEEIQAKLKAIKAKVDAAGSSTMPADKVGALLGELADVLALSKSLPNPDAPRPRKLEFDGGVRGDVEFRRTEVLADLPKDVQHQLDNAFLVGKLLGVNPRLTKTWKRLVDGSGEFKKAMDTLTAGEGLEWVPTGYSPELIAEVTQMAGVAQLHRHILMPTQVYKLPLQVGRFASKKVSENTASSGQTGVSKSAVAGTTEALTLTAVGHQAEVLYSKNLDEDSIVAVGPFARQELIMSLARGVEKAVINGDTTATHQDTDTEAAGPDVPDTLWKGYRKHALDNSYSVDFQASGNAFNVETIRKVRAKLGKYGINPGELAWVVSLQVFFKLLSLKDASGRSVVTTMDKLGAGATILTGQLGFLDGIPVLVSEFMRDDLNSSGVNGASGNTLAALACVHRPGFVFGDRRDTTVQVLRELYAEYDQDAVLVTSRQDFQPLRPIATHAAVAVGYNIDLS